MANRRTAGAATTSAQARSAGRTLTIDPVTRVGAGGLALKVEHDGSSYGEAWLSAQQYRGYETIALGRDPRDLVPLMSRACGWCGAMHMTTASMALEMAWGLRPPPMALALRTIAECTETIWIHAAHLATRAGPDYCAPVMERTSPAVWRKALGALAPNAGLHGYETIADIMTAMTPLTGRYWIDTIPAGRRVMEMISLLYGKFPHPSTITPGGTGSTLTWANFTEYFTRLYMSVDYVKQVCGLWDDLIDFLYEADPRFAALGERPSSFIQAGCWDDVRSGYSYDGLDANGAARLSRPGVMLDGKLVTDRLSDVHDGIQEHVGRSFYERAAGERRRDPAGRALDGRHPWFATNIGRGQQPDPQGRYSWCAAPRFDGHVVETSALGRLWLNALRSDFPENDFIECTGRSIRILVPMNFQPEVTVEWRIPARNNALERLRAAVYSIAFAGLCAAISLLKAFELQRSGEWATTIPFSVVKEPVAGVGLWESGPGIVAHWLSADGGRVSSYQILSPSTFNASPRDDDGQPGPIEQALAGSPVIEEPGDEGPTGIDALRVVHSFDPCTSCATH